MSELSMGLTQFFYTIINKELYLMGKQILSFMQGCGITMPDLSSFSHFPEDK